MWTYVNTRAACLGLLQLYKMEIVIILLGYRRALRREIHIRDILDRVKLIPSNQVTLSS